MILVVYIFLVLHVPGGREVTIAVNEIVSMREGEGKGEYLTDQMRCMINTEDGKFISVVETCQEVRDMIRVEVKKLGG